MANVYLEQVQPPPTVTLADRVRQLKSKGESILSLHTGDPDFDTPALISQHMLEAVAHGETHYTDSQGIPELRQAIALKCAEYNGYRPDPETEILVTHGGIHGYYLTLNSLLNPGDEIAMPDPTWPSHFNAALLSGVKVKFVPAKAEDSFLPSLEAWAKCLTPKTRAIVINYPANPTGAVPDKQYIEGLVSLAREKDLLIISDEVYEQILFNDNKPVNIASFPGARERTLSLYSFSKTYAMTGWRIGYLTGPAHLVKQIKKLSQYTITNIAPFIQKAAAYALTSEEVKRDIARMMAAYSRRRDMSIALLKEASNIRHFAPQGAFYFFIDIREVQANSVRAAEDILQRHNVAMVPGIAYGQMGEGFLRMTIAASDNTIKQGLSRFINWAKGI